MRRFLLFIAAAMVLLASGCGTFKRKQPKESSAISSEVEENFRRRWVDKRVGELAAEGVAADAARTRAENEFREKYGFTRAGGK